jgi:hypothetical protein
MKSIFTNKDAKPTVNDLEAALSDTYEIWQYLADFTKKQYPSATEDWYFSSEKYGWNFRVNDKKRALIYLLPRDKFFKIALSFGQKAYDKIMGSSISDSIKLELSNAKAYAEGRGIRIEVKDNSATNDLEELIRIKISN